MVSMHRVVAGALCLGLYMGAAASAAPDGAALISGIDLQNADDSVRIQDDFYRHVNGKWLATTQIPPDRSAYDSWFQLADDSLAQLRGIVEALLQSDFAPVQGFVLTMAVLYVALNLLIDMLYGVIDPRVRLEA